MSSVPRLPHATGPSDPPLSLTRLLDAEVLSDPYPLYRRFRETAPVLWDPLLHMWIVTGYDTAVTVLHKFSAARTPKPEQLKAMGLGALEPIAEVMVKQMLFMDGAAHARLRGAFSAAFSSRRVELLQSRIQEIADGLIDAVVAKGRMDVIGDFAARIPGTVTAELLGVPVADHQQLKSWSEDFAEMLGNFQHNPDRADRMRRSVAEMAAYYRSAIRERREGRRRGEGLIDHVLKASDEGLALSEEEIVANLIITMVGGQETTTNLIGNGLLTLLRQPTALAALKGDPGIMAPAIEELLRYESPIQHTARLAVEDTMLGGKLVHQHDAVLVVMAAANRDPKQFPDPDKLDLRRRNNRHLAFGWAAHFCFGAPLARMEGQIAFSTLLRRLPKLRLEPQTLSWRTNYGLRGLNALHVSFDGGIGNDAIP
jgi:cytochrome P450